MVKILEYSEGLAPCNRPRSITAKAVDPAFIQAHCIWPYSHSLPDDEKLYKTQAERAAEAQPNPLALFPALLIEHDILDRHALESMTQDIDKVVHDVTMKRSRRSLPLRRLRSMM